MRVIGIDPGSRICGWGVVEEAGRPVALTHIDSGAVFAPTNESLPKRLETIYNGLAQAINQYRPEQASIENVFFHKNAKSALILGQARGVAILACIHAAVPVYEYTPMQIKQAVTGYGKADKQQVAQMVKNLLRLPEVAWEDASDALASAICHLNCYKLAEATRQMQKKGT